MNFIQVDTHPQLPRCHCLIEALAALWVIHDHTEGWPIFSCSAGEFESLREISFHCEWLHYLPTGIHLRDRRERERERNLLRWTRLDDMSSRSWTVITSQLHVCFISSSVHVLYELSMWIVLFVSALLTWHKSRINREQSAGDNALVLLLNEWWECDTFSQQLYKLQNWFVQLLRSRKGTLYTAVMNVIVEWLWVERNLLHFSGFFFCGLFLVLYFFCCHCF